MANLGSLITTLGVEMGAYTRDMKRAELQAEKYARQSTKALNRVGAVAKSLGLSLAALGAGFAINKALSSFADLDKGLIGVQKTTGLTDEAINKLSEDIQEMALRIPVSTKGLLEIAQAAGQLGVQGSENILLFTETLAKMEIASDLVGERGAKALARLINTAGESTDQIKTLGSVIVALGNNMAASEAEIVHVASEVGRSTAAFEVSSSAAVAYGAAMKSMGARAELSGSAIGRAMITIEKAMIEGGDSFELLQRITGMTGDQLKKTFKTDASVVFNAFIKGMNRMSQAGKSPIVILDELGLASVEVVKGLTPLIQNVEQLEFAFKLMNEEVANATALDLEAINATKSFSAQMQLAWNAVDQIAASIGKGLAPAIIGMLKDFREWVKANKEFIQQELPNYIRSVANSLAFVVKWLIKFGKVLKFSFAFVNRLRKSFIDLRDALMTIKEVRAVVNGIKRLNKIIKETPEIWGAAGRLAIDAYVNAILGGMLAFGRSMINVARTITDPLIASFKETGKLIPDLIFGEITAEEAAKQVLLSTTRAFNSAFRRIGEDFSKDLSSRLIKIASETDFELMAKVITEFEAPEVPEMPPVVPRVAAAAAVTIGGDGIAAGIPDPKLAKQQAENYRTIITSLNNQLWGDTLSAADRYYDEQQQLENEFNAALMLSGDAKIKALQDYQNKVLQTAQEVRDGNEIVVESEDAIANAIAKVESAQQAIIASQDAMREGQLEWITSLDDSAMDATKILASLESNVDNIDGKISNLVIEMNGSQAEVTINNVKSMIDSIPDVTTKTIRIETIRKGITGGAIGGNGEEIGAESIGFRAPSFSLPVFHNGTDFVPNTGPAIVQRGEEIIPAGEARKRRGDVNINMGGITIQGINKSPEQIAREIARPLQDEMKKLDILTNQ